MYVHYGKWVALKMKYSLHSFLCHAELPKTLSVCKEEVSLTPKAPTLNTLATILQGEKLTGTFIPYFTVMLSKTYSSLLTLC